MSINTIAGQTTTSAEWIRKHSGKAVWWRGVASAQGSIGHQVKAQLLDEMRVDELRMGWSSCILVSLYMSKFVPSYLRCNFYQTLTVLPTSLIALGLGEGRSLLSKTVHPLFLSTVLLILSLLPALLLESIYTSLLNECISLSPSYCLMDRTSSYPYKDQKNYSAHILQPKYGDILKYSLKPFTENS